MSSYRWRKGVESLQIDNKEGFKENGCSKHNSIGGCLHRGFAFCLRSASTPITYAFFRIFPPAHFLANALDGLDKLKALNEKVIDEKGNEVTTQKQGEVHRGERGFKQLLEVIRENTPSKGECHSIILVEDSAGIIVGGSSDIIRFIVLREGKEEERLLFHPFDPDKSIRDLRNWVEDGFSKRLAYWMMGLLIIWLLANSYMLYLLNRPMP